MKNIIILLDLELKLDPSAGSNLFLELRESLNSQLFSDLCLFTELDLVLFLDIDI